ncbi:Protein translocase subunit SA2, chloroplastic [Asimina triloba]
MNFYAAREAEIVAQAGRKFAITISTNMAGRGTDIILGGNPKMLAKEIIEDSLLPFLTQEAPTVETDGELISQKGFSKIKVGPSSLALLAKTVLMVKHICRGEGKFWTYEAAKSMISDSIEMSQSIDIQELEKLISGDSKMHPLGHTIAHTYLTVLKDCEAHCHTEGSEVKRLGGLHVIGTSLHESRRIDNQLRGRAGRQGDPGSTRFMVSLQDEMFQKFNFDTEWAVKLISKITNNEDIPIEGDTIVKQLLSLQVNAEKYFFRIRKSLVEFDEVLERLMRKATSFCRYMQAVVDEIILGNVDPMMHPGSWNLGKLLNEYIRVGGRVLADSFAGIDEEILLSSLEGLHKLQSVDVDGFSLPYLPLLPNSFKGIRMKSSSLKRWLNICTDESSQKGRYRGTVNLLRKYLGDFVIASYLEIVHESGYGNAYVQEVEVNVRSFGHRNPLEEYKIDGCRFFISMLSGTRRLTVESLFQYWSSPMESEELYDLSRGLVCLQNVHFASVFSTEGSAIQTSGIEIYVGVGLLDWVDLKAKIFTLAAAGRSSGFCFLVTCGHTIQQLGQLYTVKC